ncbi:MAG: shikimate kinase, partial [Cyanobacteriota bacterium]|nr:shikimate kinase [Cyanobacteriota bacterium]
PLLERSDRANQLRTLLEARRDLYRQADLQIAIEADQTPEEISDRILEQIPTVLKASPPPPSPAHL